MPAAALEAYFDANLYNDIERGEIPAQDVAALRAAMARGAIVPYLSFADIEELIGLWEKDRPTVLRRLSVARDFGHFEALLKPPAEMLTDAILAYSRGVSPPSPTLPRKERRHLAAVFSKVAGGSTAYNREMSQIVADVRKLKEDAKTMMGERRALALTELEKKRYTSRDLSKVPFADFFANGAAGWAEDFAADLGVAEACSQRGLDGLLTVPRVRLLIGTAMSLVHSQVAEGRGPDFGDGYDLWHVVCASVGDVFLTRDKRLADHVDRIPGLERPKVVRSVADLLARL